MPYSDEIIISMLTKITTQLDEISQQLKQRPPVIPPQPQANTQSTANQTADQPTYVDDKQASSLTGLSMSWFRQKRVAGGGPVFIKVGRKVLYRVDTLLEYMDARMVPHTAASYGLEKRLLEPRKVKPGTGRKSRM